MFGFIHRLYIEHSDDQNNPLIYLQLSRFYDWTGIFMAGQSYMLRSKTRNECMKMMCELTLLEKKLPDLAKPEPWHVQLGCYTIRSHKEMYITALGRYIYSLTQRMDEASHYITDLDKQLSYYTDKLSQLNPHYEKLFTATSESPLIRNSPYYNGIIYHYYAPKQ